MKHKDGRPAKTDIFPYSITVIIESESLFLSSSTPESELWEHTVFTLLGFHNFGTINSFLIEVFLEMNDS